MFELNVKALAKINLGLDVLRKREDNYHEVRMVMQTVHLYDRIYMKRTRSPGIKIVTNLFYLPVNENNLVYKAAKLLMDEFGIRDGIFINLKKYIPVSAGLAGGSSDAAAVLYGLNRIFNLGLTRRQLMERGVQIGADVPYCLLRGTALAEGIGEKLTTLPPMPKCRVLIAKPAISVSTKFVYGNLSLDAKTPHPNIERLMDAIKKRNLYEMANHMGNVLETVTIQQYPVISQIKAAMMEQGAIHAMMSGSGPTVFGLFEKKDEVKKAYQVIRTNNLAKQVFIADIYNNRRRC
jgi:4-diphosphocytidyl-2-C-methyl-D-erythritol kinase